MPRLFHWDSILPRNHPSSPRSRMFGPTFRRAYGRSSVRHPCLLLYRKIVLAIAASVQQRLHQILKRLEAAQQWARCHKLGRRRRRACRQCWHGIVSRRRNGRKIKQTKGDYLHFSMGYEAHALGDDMNSNTDTECHRTLAKRIIVSVPRGHTTPCLLDRSMSAELDQPVRQPCVRMLRYLMRISCGTAWRRPVECC